jgi:hypothetical protein
MSSGEYFNVRRLIPRDAVLSHISAICRKLPVFDHTAVVVLEKIMAYASFAALLYGSTDCITAEVETPNKI